LRRVRKVLARDITTDMDLMDGVKGRRICEVHKTREEVRVIYRDVDGFSYRIFGPRHRVKVRY
jgi:hypothetical protein